MNIRRATAEDIPFMIALDRASPTSAHWYEPRFHELFAPPANRLVLIAEQALDGNPVPTPVGFLVAHHLAPEWELENLVVSPNIRRQGVGMRLVQALLSAANEAQGQAVFLEVRESNSAARRLYERAGFLPSGERKSYYSKPLEDAVVYHRSLS